MKNGVFERRFSVSGLFFEAKERLRRDAGGGSYAASWPCPGRFAENRIGISDSAGVFVFLSESYLVDGMELYVLIRRFRCVESGPAAAGWGAGVRSERRGGAPFVLARELPTCRVRRGRSGFVRERFVSDERSGESRSGPVGGPVMRLSGLSRGMDASFGAENMPLSGWRASDGVRQRAFVAVRTRTLLSVAGNRVSSGRQAAAGALFPDRFFSCGPAHRLFRKSNGRGGGRFVSTVARCPTGFVTATPFLSNVACRCGFPFGSLFAKENGCR